ncbi:MAG: hypothetical protein OXH86_02655 [Acidimicrobiaceae bacterium]|nr:hypothetical protein [Acidimicrobiaceae bacterium]MDE0318301.1 hypothetical protein [Acidimicrobiaceae bacterium]MDE0496231.1 hypothetical protein [Acidimicrobiaceae bacterium]
MRTTVTLDSDTEQMVRRRMRDRRVSFKQALNDLVREGRAIEGEQLPFRTQTAAMGRSRVSLDKALQLASESEDEELTRRMQTRS